MEQTYNNIILDATGDNFVEAEENESEEEIVESYLNRIIRRLEMETKNLPAGSDPNPFFSLDLVPIIKRALNYVVLWSAIMVPIFEYGDTTASSAISESGFNNIKSRFFKPNELPMDADLFIEKYLKIEEGDLKLSFTKYPDGEKFVNASRSQSKSQVTQSKNSFEKEQVSDNENAVEDFSTLEITNASSNKSSNKFKSGCPVCANGDAPNGAHKCDSCGKAVHAIEPCSIPKPDSEEGYGQLRICFQCQQQKRQQKQREDNEENATENWSKKRMNSQQKNSLLSNEPRLMHRICNTNSRKKPKAPLLLNGHRPFLKPALTKEFGKVSTSNTCAFDAVTSILVNACVESEIYSNHLKQFRDNSFVNFVLELTENPFKTTFHKKRTIVILQNCNPDFRKIPAMDITILTCTTVVHSMIRNLLAAVVPEENFVTVTIDRQSSESITLQLQKTLVGQDINDPTIFVSLVPLPREGKKLLKCRIAILL